MQSRFQQRVRSVRRGLDVLAFVQLELMLGGCGAGAVEGAAGQEMACPALPEAPWPGALSPRAVRTSIELGGNAEPFEIVSRAPPELAATEFGDAQLERCTARAGGVERETSLYTLVEMPDTFVVRHKYTFTGPADLSEVRGLEFEVDAADVRVSYGPADRTVYMVEDYLSVPAVPGYAKRGDMLHGGLPLNYAWNRSGGVALGVLTSAPGTYRLPLEVSQSVSLGHRYAPRSELAQQTQFIAGDVYETDFVFVTYSEGDYFEPIRRYVTLLERLANRPILDQPAPVFARRPYWKTWGLDPGASGDFTIAQVREVADELEDLGIDWILLDWGWFTAEGNWQPNDSIFESSAELSAFVSELRDRGFHVGLWFQPLQLDPTDDDVLASSLVEHAVVDRDLDRVEDDDDLWLLDPSAPAVVEYVVQQIERFAALGIEHIYLDSQMAQLASPPNFSHADPLRSHLALPALYQRIREVANKRGIAVEICPDGRSQTILNAPQHVTNIGDPKNDRQLRAEFKALRAGQGSNAIIGAYVDPFEDNRVSGSFLNIIGIGAMLQTMFREPADLGRAQWRDALELYFEEDIVSGETLDLYDIGFDYPEGHVVLKGDTRYYTFFTHTDGTDVCFATRCNDAEQIEQVEPPRERAFGGVLQLRGLTPSQRYSIRRYGTGAEFEAAAGADGTVELPDVAFDKEVLYIVAPVP